MPIYEYKCENGHVFDIMQRMSEDPLKECVECGAPVKKLMHPVNISFKGSGFYSTDYKNGKASKDKTDSKSGASDSGGSETKTETKSESNGNKKSESSSTEKASKKD